MKIDKLKDYIRIVLTSKDGKTTHVIEGKYLPLIFFNSHPRPFLVVERCCANPDCNCHTITLLFHEIDLDQPSIANLLTFMFYLDIVTWKEMKIYEQTENSQQFINEFLNNLNNDLKKRFSEFYSQAKNENMCIMKFIKKQTNILRDNRLVAYSEVFSDSGSIMYGGNSVGFEFKSENSTFPKIFFTLALVELFLCLM